MLTILRFVILVQWLLLLRRELQQVHGCTRRDCDISRKVYLFNTAPRKSYNNFMELTKLCVPVSKPILGDLWKIVTRTVLLCLYLSPGTELFSCLWTQICFACFVRKCSKFGRGQTRRRTTKLFGFDRRRNGINLAAVDGFYWHYSNRCDGNRTIDFPCNLGR